MGLAKVEGNKKLETIQSVIYWIVFVILFIAVIFYTGFRGYLAYNGNPSSVNFFLANGSIPLPALTFCPLRPMALNALQCAKETAGVAGADCMSSSYTQSVVILGLTVTCLTFNDPQDTTQPLYTASAVDEIVARVSMDPTQVMPGEPVGTMVLMHQQGRAPMLDSYSFLAGVGQATEVMAKANSYVYLNGTKVTTYAGIVTSAKQAETTVGDSLTTVNVDVQFVDGIGYHYTQEARILDPDAWIGEVGGLVCLLTFLHKVVLWLFMLLPRLLIPQQTSAPIKFRNDDDNVVI